MKRHWMGEFPDYDDVPRSLPRFVEECWSNDTCPKLVHVREDGLAITVWCDYKDPKLREMGVGGQFAVHVSEEKDYGIAMPLLSTDEWDKVRLLASLLTGNNL